MFDEAAVCDVYYVIETVTRWRRGLLSNLSLVIALSRHLLPASEDICGKNVGDLERIRL